MDRLISLSIGVNGVADYTRTFEDISRLAATMVDKHEYVNVNASLVNDSDDEDVPQTDETIAKVRRLLLEVVAPYGHGDILVDDVLYAMQNAGIVLRERFVIAAPPEDPPKILPPGELPS